MLATVACLSTFCVHVPVIFSTYIIIFMKVCAPMCIQVCIILCATAAACYTIYNIPASNNMTI